MTHLHTITFLRPDIDTPSRVLHHTKDNTGNERKWMDIIPHSHSTITTMLSSTKKNFELTIVKKIHRFSDATVKEMNTILEDSGKWSQKIEKACISVLARCQACADSGRRSDRSHI